MRINSGIPYINQLCPINEPRGFTYDVIMPVNSMLGTSSSLIKEGKLIESNYSSDMERDHESTDYSLATLNSSPMISNTKPKDKKKPLVVNGVVLDNFLASDNLNDCVDALLRKEKIQSMNFKSVIRHNSSAKSKEKRRRLRKNRE